jgi:alkylation response protein AidB-like acyl-CoA dehydrogenase
MSPLDKKTAREPAMDFRLTQEQEMIRSQIREFSRKVLLPNAEKWDAEGKIPDDIHRQLAQLGYAGITLPAEYGGSEMGPVAMSLIIQEAAYGCASTAVSLAVTNMAGEVILKFGTDDQKQRYLPRITSGEILAASFALSEAHCGSDAGALKTTARLAGDRWILNGEKMWITSGQTAGVFVLWARTGAKDLVGAKGVSAFLVEPGFKGFSVGRHENKMGLRGSSTTSLVLEDCEVPRENLLHAENRGFALAMVALDGGRISVASQAVGIARAALDEAAAYAKERRAFGQRIGDFQDIQWMIADSAVQLRAAEHLTMRAAWLKEQGRPFSVEASKAKVYASETANVICARCFQIHGGYGYVKEFPIERHVRDVRVTTIYEGTSQVQKIVISRSLVKSS